MRRAPLLLCVLAGGALAAPIPARLIYDASGTSCPGKDALISAVVRRVGTNPFDNSATSTLTVQVSAAPPGLTATVVRMKPDGTGTGRRDLKSANTNCVELFETLSLEVALAVDPLAKTAPLPAELPAPPPPPSTEPPPPPPVTARPAEGSPLLYERGEGPSDTPVNHMTRGALLAERERLERNRRSSGWPLIFAGSLAFVAGVTLNILGPVIGGSGQYVFHLVGSGAGIAGTVLLIVGIVRRVVLGEHLELFGGRLAEIDTQLDVQRRTGWIDAGPPGPQTAGALRPPRPEQVRPEPKAQ